jgi:hypothetical protein
MEPGELIVDPCCGTGEWGRIAAERGRRWIGADVVAGGAATVLAASAAGYLKRLRALFPDKHRPLHLFSGKVDVDQFPGDTLDVRAEVAPTF